MTEPPPFWEHPWFLMQVAEVLCMACWACYQVVWDAGEQASPWRIVCLKCKVRMAVPVEGWRNPS